MSTTIRPELSEKNIYWLEKHRYYELKHFCLQYPEWKKAYHLLDGFSRMSPETVTYSKQHPLGDPVTKCVESRMYYYDRMNMIERAAKDTDEELSRYILKAVTEGVSYDHLKTVFNIPCCKDTYYTLYRRFFWLLSRMRK